MKILKILALVFLFIFFVGCEDSVKRITPVADEPDDSSSDVSDDSDVTDPTNSGENVEQIKDPTDDPTNPTDSTDDPANPTDSTEPTDPTDPAGDIDPTDDTDDPTNDDSTDPTNDNDNSELTDQEKCADAGGEWDDFADNYEKICYRTINCEVPEGENAEYIIWRIGESYTQYLNFSTGDWEGATYESEYNNTGDPEICQYVCASNAVREDDTCKPICSAVFNGDSSRIEITHNDKLNLGESWTIEAWVKQDLSNLSTKENYIAGKGARSYFFGGFYKSTEKGKTYYNIKGGFYYNALLQFIEVEEDMTAETKYQNNASDSPIANGWNHVALSFYIKDGKTHLRIYINGQLAKEETSNNERTVKTNSDNLTIGYYSEDGVFGLGGSEYYFDGKIDQLKISENHYENNFTPSKLFVDDNTIAFYELDGNANDSSINGLHGSGTNVIYTTDCAF